MGFRLPTDLPRESYLGLDIGGANLKCADLAGRTESVFFPLWQRPTDLAATLADLLAPFPRAQHFAITMTGELADCFSNAAQGVQHIVEHTEQAIRTRGSAAETTRFYCIDGSFVSARQAIGHPEPLAASNWHALASVVASVIDRPTLLIDIGSTTTDLTALDPGKLRSCSRTDFDRLQTRELVYVGIERTPLCAVVETLSFEGKDVPVMNEVFATVDDCAVLAGLTPEAPTDCRTADGRPRTLTAARGRLAKMIGLDHRSFSIEQARSAAEACLQALTASIECAAEAVAPDAKQWVLGGHGTALLERWGRTNTTTLALPHVLLPLCQPTHVDSPRDGKPLPEEDGVRRRPESGNATSISRVAPAFATAYLLARQTCTASSK